MQPSSARTGARLARAASMILSRWPGLAVMMAITWIMTSLLRCLRDAASIATLYNTHRAAPPRFARPPLQKSSLVRLFPLCIERAQWHHRPGDADRPLALRAESWRAGLRRGHAGRHLLGLSDAPRGDRGQARGPLRCALADDDRACLRRCRVARALSVSGITRPVFRGGAD